MKHCIISLAILSSLNTVLANGYACKKANYYCLGKQRIVFQKPLIYSKAGYKLSYNQTKTSVLNSISSKNNKKTITTSYYKVKKDEGLWQIAARYKVPVYKIWLWVEMIATFNHLTEKDNNGDYILTSGNVLKIPINAPEMK